MDETIYFQSVKIIEINENTDEKVPINGLTPEYLVEEPCDYIFEPNHNPPEIPTTVITETVESTSDPKMSIDQEIKYKDGVKLLNRIARMVNENDGVLEYEYKSHADVKSTIDEDEDFFENYFNDFDYKHHHLNAVIRSISLSKYPGSGFGFKLDRHLSDTEDLFYVKEITPDTPAEVCLRLGDIILEIDEKNPGKAFQNLDDAHDYMTRNDNIHMMAIHESKYVRLKSENEDLIKNYCINCEDMVIVSWNKQYQENCVN